MSARFVYLDEPSVFEKAIVIGRHSFEWYAGQSVYLHIGVALVALALLILILLRPQYHRPSSVVCRARRRVFSPLIDHQGVRQHLSAVDEDDEGQEPEELFIEPIVKPRPKHLHRRPSSLTSTRWDC
jgi:hypothetical protein